MCVFCYCIYVELIETENNLLSININFICISGLVTRQHKLSGNSWLWSVISWRGSGLGERHNGHRHLSTCWGLRTHWPGSFISKKKETQIISTAAQWLLFLTVVFLYSQGYSPALMESSVSARNSKGLDSKCHSRGGDHQGWLLGSHGENYLIFLCKDWGQPCSDWEHFEKGLNCFTSYKLAIWESKM